MSDSQAAVPGQRFQILEILGKGGMGAVYRVHDRLMNRQVALKRVELPMAKGSAPPPDAARSGAVAPTMADIAALATLANNLGAAAVSSSAVVVVEQQAISRERLLALRLALANEFQTLAALRHPNIVSVLDYGFAADGQPFFTMELLVNGQSLRQASRLCSLAEKVGLLLQILQALSYIHRRGVLHRDLKPANILCIQSPAGTRVKLLDFGLAQLRQHHQREQQEISGTLGYIAPEVMRGQPVTLQADLYAFGVVAFELLTDRALFHDTGQTALLAAAFSPAPALDAGKLPSPLQEVLRQLLSPDPAARFASAESTARALAAAVDLPPLIESAELRDCILGSAELVGRDAELALLTSALKKMLRGHGQLSLLAGESGIGKSRLLEELRTRALVEGARVLRVQASSVGNADIGIFSDALRTLCLDSTPPLLTAGVLKGIITDLPLLLQCDIPDASEIDAQAARQRLLGAVQTTLLSGQQPTLILVEDLHWAGPDSVEVLRQLSGQLGQRPLLLVGTYRSEERPELPSELPDAQVCTLSRLHRDDIARLSTSILGEGRASARFLDWLTTQSEGNSFFITEAMRAVAEEVGSLAAVGEAPLLQGILTGGMDAVLRRRLSRVPVWAQPLLQKVAIAGRQLDLAVLRVFDDNLEDWLRVCAAAGVLEVHQPSWRFCHDKLRERLLADMPAPQQRAVHLQLAEAIERVHADAAATLAFHYEQGGNLPKAAAYAAAAGESAARHGALAEALSLLQKARTLQDQLGLPDRDKVQSQSLLAETLYGLSQFEAGLAAVAQALSLLGQPLPDGKSALGWGVLKQVATQILGQLIPPFGARSRHRPESPTQLAEAWLHILNVDLSGYLGHMESVLYSTLRVANIGVAHRELRQSFPFQLGLDFILALVPLPLPAGQKLDEVVAALPQITDAKVQLLIMRGGGAIYHYRGQQVESRALLTRALAKADELLDSTTQRMVLSYLIRTTSYLGEYAASLQYARRMFTVERTAADVGWHQYAGAVVGIAYLRRGELVEADSHLLNALTHAHKESAHMVVAARALNLAMMGRNAEAQQQLAAALPVFEQAPINILNGIESYRMLVEVALLLWERAATPGEHKAAAHTGQRALAVLRSFAVRSPHGWADFCLLQGRAAWLKGDLKQASLLLTLAPRLAEHYQMRPTAALARCWLGRVKSGPAGRRLIQEGLAQLQTFGARWHVDAIKQWPSS